MATFVLALAVFLIALTGMALGVLFGRRRIEGSCGGLNRLPGVESDCGGTCTKPCPRRRAN